MLSTIYLLKFNNYYNRQVKMYDSLSGYLLKKDPQNENSEYSFLCKGFLNQNPIPNVNFIPADNVNTTLVINWDGEAPDYLLVVENGEIISRWFVIDSNRNLKGQYEIMLHRDLVADYYQNVLTSPMFIEKGYVGVDDSAIFNPENMTFNQIKKSEYLLKDGTKTSWIVGYIAPGDGVTGETINYGSIPTPDFIEASIEDWKYYEFYEEEGVVPESSTLKYHIRYFLNSGYSNTLTEVTFTNNAFLSTETISGYAPALVCKYANRENVKKYVASLDLEANVKNQFKVTSNFNMSEINGLQNKIIKTGTGNDTEYWRINVSVSSGTVTQSIRTGTNSFNSFDALVESVPNAIYGTPNDESFYISYTLNEVAINLSKMTVLSGFTTILRKDRPILNDAPYCMFCIPFGDYNYKKADGTTIEVDKTNSFFLASGIAKALGGTGTSKIYDLQLLPFCPIGYLRDQGNTVDLKEATDVFYTENTDSKTIIFYPTTSSGNFNIKYNFYTDIKSNIIFKINAQTSFWRLCSPNYNGVFEFNPYKNNGTSYIDVDYNYKPHQPYIHLNPNFDGLYGSDFNDARGLICGGDFSLPIVDNAWVDYQISNKNFQNIFNRQIESMEIQHDIQNRLDRVNAIAGSVSGALSGAMVGTLGTGSGYGGLVGAIGGGLISYGAGQADIKYNKILRNEVLDSTKDLFGYQLGNIKALPDALTRVGSFNENNKIFPFIERYDATDIEKKALEDKIIYNGMSIGRIGKLEDFIINKPFNDWGYFKGQFIRLEDFDGDYHESKALAEELNKGVYII